MGKPSAPTPPDPTVTANAQSAANIASATAQQKLNMVNTSGPYGSVNYSADPNAPGGYSQNTTLSPAEQAIFNQSTQAQGTALGIANNQLGNVASALGQNVTPGQLASNVSGGPVQTSYNQGGPIATGYNPGQAVQGQIGPQDFNQSVTDARNAVYNQATSRLDPQWGQATEKQQSDLANQGFSQNSAAYQTAMDNFNRSKNDAYTSAQNQAETTGIGLQNQLFNQSAQQGQFANAAAGQQYSQNQGQAAFQNTAQQQANLQNQNQATFANAGQGQQFAQGQQNAQLQNQTQGTQFQQGWYGQQQPINEFNALMSSGQVQAPTGVQYSPTAVANTDVLGAYALNQQAQQNAYQSQMQNYSSTMGGLFNLGGAAMMAASDRRLKRDVVKLATRTDGLGVYSFRYLNRDETLVGVMAQEVQKVIPEAVHVMANGFLMVDYAMLEAA